MGERLVREYGVATYFEFDLWDWTDPRARATVTPAAGDAKISQEGGSQSNVATLFSDSNDVWIQQLSAAEMQAAQLAISYEDQDGPAFVPRTIFIETYGGPDSLHGGLSSSDSAAWEAAVAGMREVVVDTGSSASSIIAKSITPASVADDQFTNRRLYFDEDTTTTELRGQAKPISAFNHSTQTFSMGDGGFTTAPAEDDTCVIV